MTVGRYQIDVQVDESFADQVDPQMLQGVVSATLTHLQWRESALTVVVTDDRIVQEFNRQYRDVDTPTDVLSFAGQEQLLDIPTPALPEELKADLDRYLGDILIAYPYAKRQAAQYGNSVQAELRLLAVHGTLHLLGYDHANPQEEAAMWALQEAILTQYGDSGLSCRSYG